jgi:5-methyltetrahydropteroyltriglutamate--homocysteine methyltransferase
MVHALPRESFLTGLQITCEDQMRRSEQRIITTHVGSLSRPPDLLALNAARTSGAVDAAAYGNGLAAAVTDTVKKQGEVGIDIPNDGEFGKPMSVAYDYGAWWNYAFERLEGFAAPDSFPEAEHKKSTVAELSLTSFARRRDWEKFSEFYQDPASGLIGSAPARRQRRPVCIGPIRYKGHTRTQADIANLKRGLAAAGIAEGFMTAVSPASFARGEDLHYENEEDFVAATAEALREEYKAIVDAGLVLQIDDPSLPDNWDMINPQPPLDEFKKFSRVRIDALNYALRGLPEDRIRYHICWGSWHGPHTSDIALVDIADLVLAVRAQGYSVEAANVRHEHEWRVWRDVKLPDGKILIPGVVSHATNVVEHPRVVADRIMRFAQVAGRENVIASTDCGLGGRVHPQIAWAKLAALADGAKLATAELWP